MYKKIVNPKTGRIVKITSKLGQKVLNNYLLQIGGHKGPCAINPKTNNCKKSKKGDGNCMVVKGRCKKIKTGKKAQVFSLDLTNGGKIKLEKIAWKEGATDAEEEEWWETNYDLEDEFEEKKKKSKNLDKILTKAKEGDLIEDLSDEDSRGLEGVYILKRNLRNGKLEVVDLDPFNFWRGEGGVGKGFSLGPEYPMGYWNKAKFDNKNTYWPNPGDDFGMPQPVNKEFLLSLTVADLTEKSVSGEIISCVKFNWGTLEFVGKKKEVIKKIKNINFIDDNAYFMEHEHNQMTARLVDWQW